jgi:hypothetical protein
MPTRAYGSIVFGEGAMAHIRRIFTEDSDKSRRFTLLAHESNPMKSGMDVLLALSTKQTLKRRSPSLIALSHPL